MKVIILVLTAESGDFPLIESASKETWASVPNDNIEIFYYYGNKSHDKIAGNSIFSTSPEGYQNIGKKTITAFELLKERDFDYLFRTNTSSYIVKDNILRFVEDKPRNNFYCGIIGRGKINFCSGSGYFLSKDVLLKVVENKHLWNHDLIDDVAIGELIEKKLGIQISDGARRLDIHDMGRPYTFEDLKSHYHIRCAWHHDRNVDVYHMNNIHKMLKQ